VGSLVLPDGRRVSLSDAATSLGRNSDCTVSLADPRASRRHAEIRPTGDGFLLVDLGSMNGTLVNGVAVRERLLHDGDEIALGATVMRFEAS
jgi:pSer/pThr/pTyr-binding forkhead associated (FHA) protein